MLISSNYHYIRNTFKAKYPSIFGQKPGEFKNQLNQLAQLGSFVSQSDLQSNAEYIIRSNEKFVLITFDDGLKEQFEVAKPILDELDIPAIYFINSINHLERKVSMVHKIQLVRSVASPKKIAEQVEHLGVKLSGSEYTKAVTHYNYDSPEAAATKYLLNFKLQLSQRDEVVNKLFELFFDESAMIKELYMSEEQLKLLATENALGNHTHAHLGLGIYAEETIANEIKITKEYLERLTNQEITTISYPYGSPEACAEPVPRIAEDSGHSIGFTMNRGIAQQETSLLMLNRFDCNDLPGGKNEKLFLDEFYS